MLKELEEKAVLNFIEPEEKEIKAVQVSIDFLDNEIFVQNHIPEKDYIELYKECIKEIVDVFDDPDMVVKKVLLDKYSNIYLTGLKDKEIEEVFDKIEYTWIHEDVVWRLFDNIYKYYDIFVKETIVRKVIEEFFNDQITRNAFEQIQEELETMNMDKIKGLLEVFGVSNKLNLKG